MRTELLVAITNLLFCLQRLVSTFRAGRLSATVWALATYFSIFLVIVIIGGPFVKYRGFTGDAIFVRQQALDFSCYYIASFHLIFAITETSYGNGSAFHKAA